MPNTYMISGGGTGGHIFPAVAIAQEIQRRHPDAEIRFVGARNRMEMERVPAAGFAIDGIDIAGFNRTDMTANILFPVKLVKSLLSCRKLLLKYRPSIVIGTGGFASGPLLWVAQNMGIPTIIQEQNSLPGVTNKILGKKAKAICVAYEGLDRYFPKEKIALTGNPIRETLLDTPVPKESDYLQYNLQPDRKTLVVLGGSLGARKINEVMERIYPSLIRAGYQVIWQCGKLYYETLKVKLGNEEGLVLADFITDMKQIYSLADVIVSRAGAGTISELQVVGKPAILIPSPNVAEDHQTKNAEAVERSGGAIMVRESEIDQLKEVLIQLIHDEDRRKELSSNLRAQARPEATKAIVDELEKWI